MTVPFCVNRFVDVAVMSCDCYCFCLDMFDK